MLNTASKIGEIPSQQLDFMGDSADSHAQNSVAIQKTPFFRIGSRPEGLLKPLDPGWEMPRSCRVPKASTNDGVEEICVSRTSHHYLAENLAILSMAIFFRWPFDRGFWMFQSTGILGVPGVPNGHKNHLVQSWLCLAKMLLYPSLQNCSDPQVPTKPEKKYVVKSLVVAQSHSNLTVKFANDSGNFCCRLSIAGMTPAFSSERSSRFGGKISWCRNKTFKANMLRTNKCVLWVCSLD